MTDHLTELSSAIRVARVRRGVSLAALASECGLSRSQLSRYEQGLATPTLSSLQKLSAVLGPIHLHFGESEDSPSEPRFGAGDDRRFLKSENLRVLSALISDEMIVDAKSNGVPGGSHPVYGLVSPASGLDEKVTRLTDRLFAAFTRHDITPQWIQWARRKLRQASQNTRVDIASASLGELRTAGRILSEGHSYGVDLQRSSRNQAGCDFRVCFYVRQAPADPEQLPSWERGRGIGVEVHTMQMAGSEADRLVAFHSDPPAPDPATGIGMKTTFVDPAGKSRSGETRACQLARKLAQTKDTSGQQLEGAPTILWLDLMSPTWRSLHMADASILRGNDFLPLHKSGIGSSGVWHSFYGRKGDWVSDRGVPGGWLCPHKLPIDGRFEDSRVKGDKSPLPIKERWSGAILAFLDGCVFFQNPNAKFPLEAGEIQSVMALGCDPMRSRFASSADELRHQLALDRARVEMLCR